MTANDKLFLQAIGIKPEEIVPAAVAGAPMAYEKCPNCGRNRHRFIEDGFCFCLSCAAREQREKRYEAALARANAAADLDRLHVKTVDVTYRGFQIAHLDGVGWCYRCPPVEIFRHWMKANSFEDAQRRVDRIVTAESKEYDEPIVAQNQCRECGSPCGQMSWCGPCGKAKFL